MRMRMFEYFDPTGLTGRRRYRAHDHLIVLQVEERGVIRHAGTGSEHEAAVRWRDATTEDLTEHAELQVGE